MVCSGVWLRSPAFVACVLLIGCDGDGDGAEPARDAAGSHRDAASDDAGRTQCEAAPTDGVDCVNEGDENAGCPELPPADGSCAPKGPCCQRASNRLKEEQLLCEGAPAVLEYRVIEHPVSNFPNTLGDPELNKSSLIPYETDPPVTLWRFELPRSRGQRSSGRGRMAIGPGRDNCDGTYSFYGEQAAPEVAGVSTDAARWAPITLGTRVETDEGSGTRIAVIAEDEALRRGLLHGLQPGEASGARGFEIVRSGYAIRDLALDAERRDCMGARDATGWVAGGTIESYLPLAENDRELIALIGQSYCQLLGFGILPMAAKDAPCLALPRCEPNSDLCRWKKLPDSLCPTNADERARFGCHLGAEGNVNQEHGYPDSLRCGADAGDEGPCCDPLGASTSLPACNAYRALQDYTAYAAEITRTPAAELGTGCM